MERVSERLEEGAALFTLLGRIFHGVPDRELFAEIADQRVFDEVPFATGSSADEALRYLTDWTDGCAVPFSDDDFHSVSAEYTRLFVGTRRVLAPMWESVYFNRDRMVFQRETFEVRAMYRAYGLEVDALSHEPDDHLAYELLFVARLMTLASERLAKGCLNEARQIVSDMVSFVVCHPLSWVDRWLEEVRRATCGGFYRGYAELVVVALRQVEDEFAPVMLDAVTA